MSAPPGGLLEQARGHREALAAAEEARRHALIGWAVILAVLGGPLAAAIVSWWAWTFDLVWRLLH